MNMRQRAPNILKEWAVVFGLLILLHVAVALGWVLLDPAASRSVAAIMLLMLGYVIGLAVVLFVFYRRIGRASEPLEYREARAQGFGADGCHPSRRTDESHISRTDGGRRSVP